MTPPATPPDISAAVLLEAADWMVALQSGEADQEALARWRARSPAHEAAWRRAEQVFAAFRQAPAAVARPALARLEQVRLENAGRRRALRLALLIGPAAPLLWAGWRFGAPAARRWNADLRTATGERRSAALADGGRVTLNTASALDVVFNEHERRLVLWAGETLIVTARDPAAPPRPFVVDTAEGRLQALGTRFSVRRADGPQGDETRVTVFEGAVEIRPAGGGAPVVLAAGMRTAFTAAAVEPPSAADPDAALWEQGMLLARAMPLGALVAELARYRRGVLRCDLAVAGMLVSGAFPIGDVDASLALLERTLPLRVRRRADLWTTVGPAE